MIYQLEHFKKPGYRS